jgi:hypothetical protein
MSLSLDLKERVWCLLELPNTLDRGEAQYRWRYHDLLGYLMIPRSVDRETGTVDLYFCIDDDDCAVVDIEGYLRAFLVSLFREKYPRIGEFRLRMMERAAPPGVTCRVRTHVPCEVDPIAGWNI